MTLFCRIFVIVVYRDNSSQKRQQVSLSNKIKIADTVACCEKQVDKAKNKGLSKETAISVGVCKYKNIFHIAFVI